MRHRKLLRFLLLAIILFPAPSEFVSRVLAQGPPPEARSPQPEDEERARMEKDMAKKANQQRHANLKRDTETLLKLTTELKQYVDKSNENVLSLDVIKKAEEIEKLAHNVKEKMKGD